MTSFSYQFQILPNHISFLLQSLYILFIFFNLQSIQNQSPLNREKYIILLFILLKYILLNPRILIPIFIEQKGQIKDIIPQIMVIFHMRLKTSIRFPFKKFPGMSANEAKFLNIVVFLCLNLP